MPGKKSAKSLQILESCGDRLNTFIGNEHVWQFYTNKMFAFDEKITKSLQNIEFFRDPLNTFI